MKQKENIGIVLKGQLKKELWKNKKIYSCSIVPKQTEIDSHVCFIKKFSRLISSHVI